MNKAILKTCFFLFIPIFACYSQSNAIVYGKLVDANKNPIQDVAVSIFQSSQKPVFTNKDGFFEYLIPAEKDVLLIFTHINYQPVKKVFNLSVSARQEFNTSLLFNTKTDLNEVQIIDDAERTNNLIRIDPKMVNQIPSASGDFNAILFSQPGVVSRNELSSSYSVRGGNFDENLVYVNDIEVYRPFLTRSGQQEGLSFINSDMVSSVLFSAGGFEAKYGDKMASVLDVKYKKPRKFAATASASLLGAHLNLENNSKDNRLTWMLGSRYKTNRYLFRSLETDGDYFPSFTDVQSFITYDISEKWEVNFLGNYAKNKFQLIPESRETSFGTVKEAYRFKVYFDGQEIDEYETFFSAVSFINKPSDKLRLRFTTSAYRSFENESFDILGQYFIDQLETDFGKPNFGEAVFNRGVGSILNHGRNKLDILVYNFEHKGQYEFKRNNNLLWGLKYQHEAIADKLSEWKYIDSAGFSIPQGNPSTIELQDIIRNNQNISSDRLSGYFQYVYQKELKDTSELSITSGIRGNYWTLNNQFFASPRITISYKPNWKKDFLFRASSGFYYQPPFYRELRDLNGNVNYNVKAQQSVHYVLSSDLNFRAWNRPFKFITEAYYKNYTSLIPYEIDNVRIRYYATNNTKGYATGMDFKINGEFIKGVESWASLSFLQTKEDILDDYYYDYYNSDGKVIIPGYTFNNIKVDSIKYTPGYIPRQTDQRLTFSMFFQDYIPQLPDCKMHLNFIYGTGIPVGPPTYERYKDTLRMPPYRRVDIGFSYQFIKEEKPLPKTHILHHLKSVWLSLEVFNLLQVNNTVSYLWVKDVSNRVYAIPNYLTARQLNLKLIIKI